jgi:SAM-dependent methyltransferase
MSETSKTTSAIRRLHWGCGRTIAPGWINSDVLEAEGIDLPCNITKGLPLPDAGLDYIACHHALQDLGIYEQVDAMKELRRVLKPGGVLRAGLPDLDLFIAAYQRRDSDFFFVTDWDTIDGNFITHALWYNITRTPMTYPFAEELLKKAGFRRVQRSKYGQTASDWPEIASLDSRESESFFVEAWK